MSDDGHALTARGAAEARAKAEAQRRDQAPQQRHAPDADQQTVARERDQDRK